MSNNMVHTSIKKLMLAIALVSWVPAADSAGRNLYRFETGLRVGDAQLFTPWWNVLQRNTLQRVTFDLCMSSPTSCSRRQRALRQLVLRGKQLGTQDQLELVNRYLNSREYENDTKFNRVDVFDHLSDPDQNVARRQKVRSHWSTLYEFVQRGGDCEDYAASKYFLLRMLGVDPEQMRVVVTKSRQQRGYHAVLAYRWQNGDVWLLESDNVVKKRSHAGYRYVYALNENGIWDYRDTFGK